MKIEMFGFRRALVFEYDSNTFEMTCYFRNKATQHLGAIYIQGSSIDSIIDVEKTITSLKKEYMNNNNHYEFFKALYARLSESYVLQHIQLKSFAESKKALKHKAVIEMKEREYKALSKKSNVNAIPKVSDVFEPVESKIIEHMKLSINELTGIVDIITDNTTKVATLKYRKSWSYRKYVDYVLSKTKLKPSFDFIYGWEIC